MSKAIIAGSACVIFSSLTPEDVHRLKTFSPDALTIRSENGEAVFRLDIDDDGLGSISPEGAVLGCATSAEGKATITVIINPAEENKLKLVQDRLGPALLRLEEMEAFLLGQMETLAAAQDRATAMIKQM